MGAGGVAVVLSVETPTNLLWVEGPWRIHQVA